MLKSELWLLPEKLIRATIARNWNVYAVLAKNIIKLHNFWRDTQYYYSSEYSYIYRWARTLRCSE